MGLLKKIKKRYTRIPAQVFIFDEGGGQNIYYNYQLPKNITITGKNNNNIVKIHKNLKARHINIDFSENAHDCTCVLEDSGNSTGLDICVYFLPGEKSELKIGKRTEMNGTRIWLGNGSKCYIGNDCMFSYEIIIRTTDGHTIVDLENKEVLNNQKVPCTIGDHCWIGLRSVINKNVQLAHDTIVGSGSTVTKQFSEPYTVVAGNPAKVIKTGVKHDRRTIYEYLKSE